MHKLVSRSEPVVLVVEVTCPKTGETHLMTKRCGSVDDAMRYRAVAFHKLPPGWIESLDGQMIVSLGRKKGEKKPDEELEEVFA